MAAAAAQEHRGGGAGGPEQDGLHPAAGERERRARAAGEEQGRRGGGGLPGEMAKSAPRLRRQPRTASPKPRYMRTRSPSARKKPVRKPWRAQAGGDGHVVDRRVAHRLEAAARLPGLPAQEDELAVGDRRAAAVRRRLPVAEQRRRAGRRPRGPAGSRRRRAPPGSRRGRPRPAAVRPPRRAPAPAGPGAWRVSASVDSSQGVSTSRGAHPERVDLPRPARGEGAGGEEASGGAPPGVAGAPRPARRCRRSSRRRSPGPRGRPSARAASPRRPPR